MLACCTLQQNLFSGFQSIPLDVQHLDKPFQQSSLSLLTLCIHLFVWHLSWLVILWVKKQRSFHKLGTKGNVSAHPFVQSHSTHQLRTAAGFPKRAQFCFFKPMATNIPVWSKLRLVIIGICWPLAYGSLHFCITFVQLLQKCLATPKQPINLQEIIEFTYSTKSYTITPCDNYVRTT